MTNLLNGLWQGAVLTGLVWILLKTLPRQSAATRYGVWWITLLAVVALPLRGFVGEAVSDGGSSVRESTTSDAGSFLSAVPHLKERANMLDHKAVIVTRFPGVADPEVAATSPWHPIYLAARPIAVAVMAAWCGLSLLLMIRLGLAYRMLRRLKRTGQRPSADLQARLDRVARDAGIGRRVRLLVSDETDTPLALGFLDPVVLIPGALANDFENSEFDHLALHELAHLSRLDDWANLFQQLLVALLPIQPALFWIGRQMNLEREAACDDRVVASAGNPKPYAVSLTRIAERVLKSRSLALASGVGGNRSQLYRRIHRLLDGRSNTAATASVWVLLVAGASIVALASIGLSAPRLVALADSPGTGSKSPAGPPPTGVADNNEPDAAPTTLPSDVGAQSKSFGVKSGEKLVADVDLGVIHVESWDREEVRIDVIQMGKNAEEFMRHHRITMGRQKGQVTLRASSDGLAVLGADVKIAYDIQVPRRFDVQIKNGVGDLEFTGLHGALSAVVGDGNINAADCGGALEGSTGAGNIKLQGLTAITQVRTGAGNIKASGCESKLSMITKAGNIEMAKTTGGVDARTDNGNVESSDAGGDVVARVGAGNIDIGHFTGTSVDALTKIGNVSAEIDGTLKSKSSLETNMGNVDLKIAAGVGLKLDISAAMGNVDSNVSAGNIHGGGPALRVASQMGNVDIDAK